MPIADSVRRYLEAQHVDYELVSYPGVHSIVELAEARGIPPVQIAIAEVLEDARGTLLVVYPANRELDVAALKRQLNRDLDFVTETALRSIFPDCELDAWPPLGEPYGLQVIVDQALDGLNEVYFPVGSATTLAHMRGEDFQELQVGAWHGSQIAQIISVEDRAQSKRAEVRRCIAQLNDLPAMPEMAHKLLRLRNDERAGARELAAVIELDPSLSAQLIRYAESPLYGYRGKIASIQDAISRVLGFELVMDIAFGVTLGKSFRTPPGGPLGLNAFWRHAIYTAALTQSLGNAMPRDRRPLPGLAYLAGLLHNFGFLLLGHMFPVEFRAINRAFEEDPDRRITDIELQHFGMTHQELGAWLMQAWQLPEELITAIREHHEEGYDADHAVYANLVLIADRLLRCCDLGDAETEDLPEAVLIRLGLERGQAERALDEMTEGRDSLDSIATRMVG